MHKFSKKNYLRYSIARNLIFGIFLSSVVVNAVYIIYISSKLYATEKSLLMSLLVDYEEKQLDNILRTIDTNNTGNLNQLLEPFLNFSIIKYAGISRNDKVLSEVGDNLSIINNEKGLEFHYFDLPGVAVSNTNAQSKLTIAYSLERVNVAVKQQSMDIALLKVVEMLLVSVIILFIFFFIIGKHLITISNYAKDLTLGKLGKPLEILRASNHYNEHDEISRLSDSINLMRLNLKSSLDKNYQADLESEKLIKQLQDKNSELERFTYTVSHDLKSPLVTINGYIGLLEQDLKEKNPEGVYENVQVIKNAAKTMHSLLSDLLELSRVGAYEGDREVVSFNTILNEVQGLLADQITVRHTTIEIEENLPLVEVELVRFKEVFLNLIENSLKYMGSESSPVIRIGIDSVKDQHGEQVEAFYVKDNGIGIKPEYCNKVFKLFERLNNDVDGTGVGLAIVSRILETHHGRIWVESEGLGKGCTFYFVLPLVGRKDHD